MRVVFIFFAFLNTALSGERVRNEISFRSDYQVATAPLILERVWALAPTEWNPQEKLWILSRNSELVGLKAIALPGGLPEGLKEDRFGVSADFIKSEARSYFSPALLSGLQEGGAKGFSCNAKPTTFEDYRFGTSQGARIAAGWAAQAWDEAQNLEKDLLAMKFSKIREKKKDAAISRGLVEWENVRYRLEKQWRDQIFPRIKAREWKYYLEEARKAGVCPRPKGGSVVASAEKGPITKSAQPNSDHDTLLLARAPARKWNGLFSVRLSLEVGGRKLNGKFLIDSKADVSLVSPLFLSAQGIPPLFVQTPGLPPEPYKWSGAHEGRLGKHARFDAVDLGGFALPLREFLIAETEIFSPPENVATCCDGVLGKDFLSQAVVEFYPGPPAEVRLWSRQGFVPSLKQHETSFFLETRLVAGGAPQVECQGLLMSLNTGKQEDWQSGSKVGSKFSVACGDWQWQLPVKTSRLELGMGVLGLAPVIFDLPHDRIWLSEKLKTPGFMEGHRNQSGLTLKYDYRDSERVLLVVAIANNLPAQRLLKEGLRPGMVITEVDGKPSDEFDQWDIVRKLSGASGEQLTLTWEKKAPGKGDKKLVPFKVK
ncbi:hypothetical protein WDW86_19645 [Bdellovibrionota bacterium FG-2]